MGWKRSRGRSLSWYMISSVAGIFISSTWLLFKKRDSYQRYNCALVGGEGREGKRVERLWWAESVGWVEMVGCESDSYQRYICSSVGGEG